MKWSGVEIATVTWFCESVNGMLLCMKNRVWKCNSEGIASLMSRNERIRRPSSVNSRFPTCAHCEFNGDWSWRLHGLCWRCTLVNRLCVKRDWNGNRARRMLLIAMIASNPCGIACIPSSIGAPSLCNLWECISSSSVWITLAKHVQQA